MDPVPARRSDAACARDPWLPVMSVWVEMATAFGHAQAHAVEALREIGIVYSAMSEDAALRAAECWYRFRKRSKGKDRIVADFLVGGHALVQSKRTDC